MHYLLTSSLILTGFYAVYWFLFRKLSFHTWNRCYLLFALVLSLIIPLLPVLPRAEAEMVVEAAVTDEQEAVTSEPVVAERESTNWFLWGERWYLVVAGVLLVRLIIRVGIVARQIHKKDSNDWEDLRVFPYTKGQSASFFGWVFLNDTLLSSAEREQVLRHEQLHYHLYHSADRLLIECVKAVAWMNPVSYWWGRSLTDLHEYEVDERMARDFETREYAHLLLKLATRSEPVLMNRFAREPLKSRIQFLFTKPSQTMKKSLFLLVLPLTASAVMLFAQQVPSASEKPRQPAPPSFPTGRIAPPPPPQPADFSGWKPYVVNYRDYERFLNAAKTTRPKWESLVPGDWAAGLARYGNQPSVGVKSVNWEQAETFVEWKNWSNQKAGLIYRMAEAGERKSLPYGIWCVRAVYPVKGEARVSPQPAIKEVRSARMAPPKIVRDKPARMAPPVIERDRPAEVVEVRTTRKKAFVESTIVEDEPAPRVDVIEFKGKPTEKKAFVEPTIVKDEPAPRVDVIEFKAKPAKKKAFVEPTIVDDEPAPKVDVIEFRAKPKKQALGAVKPDAVAPASKEQQKTPARP